MFNSILLFNFLVLFPEFYFIILKSSCTFMPHHYRRPFTRHTNPLSPLFSFFRTHFKHPPSLQLVQKVPTFCASYNHLKHSLPATTHTVYLMHLNSHTFSKQPNAYSPAIILLPLINLLPWFQTNIYRKGSSHPSNPPSFASFKGHASHRFRPSSAPAPAALSINLALHRLRRVYTHELALQDAPELVLAQPQLKSTVNSSSPCLTTMSKKSAFELTACIPSMSSFTNMNILAISPERLLYSMCYIRSKFIIPNLLL